MSHAASQPPAGALARTDPPALLGGRNRVTGQYLFPLPENHGDDIEPVELASAGTIWSYTVQRFRPKTPPYLGPEEFEPYIVAYVSLPDQLIVEGRLVDIAIENVEIGMAVELVTIPQTDNSNGGLAHAFRPASGENRA